jgi:nucleoside diphosphate kinase
MELIVAIVLAVLLLLFIHTQLKGKITSKQPIYVINGFYMSMRDKYTKAAASIHYYTVEWDSSKLSWADFRAKVLGATDPGTADAGSLRRMIYDRWEELGLSACPDVGDNGVHGSASPFEALTERRNWLGATLEKDDFARAMSSSGVKKTVIETWTRDPQVPHDGKSVSVFDSLEDLDSKPCLEMAFKLAGVKGPKVNYTKNEAFIFLKPHAVTAAAKELVTKTLADHGVNVIKEGKIDGATIDNDKLIDNHYYAIANKAALSKPKELNPPEEKQKEFADKFGITWPNALRLGKVYNAVDGCGRLGLTGDAMDKQWASAKKGGKLVKFGGGFYAALVDPAP